MLRWLVVASVWVAILLAPGRLLAGSPWLVVSDLHFDPLASPSVPMTAGHDTNGVLLDASLAEMRAVDPNPPVVIIAGDLLAHSFDRSQAAATFAYLAKRFGAAFPHAQFVLTLGNNDSACGDYELQPADAFLRSVAHAWSPLVARPGVTTDFTAGFARDGSYTTTLPTSPSTRAIVLADVYWSPRYRDACGPRASDPAASLVNELRDDLAAGHGKPAWVILHIPPGIDAFSTTKLAHQLITISFLQDDRQRAALALLEDTSYHVGTVIAGHSHKFAFRLAGSIPLLLVPSISPVYDNNPSFVTLDVAPDGRIRDVTEFSQVGAAWQRVGDLRALGVTAFDAAQLRALHDRLENDPALRAAFARLYDGDASVAEITESNWRAYWCAAVDLSAGAYRTCAALGPAGRFGAHAAALAAMLLAALAAIVGGMLFFRAGLPRKA